MSVGFSDYYRAKIIGKSFSIFCFQGKWVKVSVKENEVPTEKNSSRASIFATMASYISN